MLEGRSGLAALFLRQFGHAILEPPCHDKEEALLGYNYVPRWGSGGSGAR